ncbi:axoneme-associated protein mst101(2)-like [Quillaja saponaria]|uniref:Axoneme-associated protein mst101(2)-like n=1 Tax=Quillaja saponaria TaxID=32244 RepID=A0AAD7L5S9_QUISA|nr:axoneme-associated protein mst101(2)-like [Quillaja saponaria]KAJ7952116.1 axoneme-associated protein mst101(2)-like [Quillaja saponaria]
MWCSNLKMRVGSPPLCASDNEGEEELSKQSISELIAILRTAFKSADFDQVEEVLVARETKLRSELKNKEKEISLLQNQNEVGKLDIMRIEGELKLYKERCQDLSCQIRCVDEDSKHLKEKEKSAIDRYEKLLKEVKKGGQDDESIIVELRSKTFELENAKMSAEAEMKIWKTKFLGLDERLLWLEKGLVKLMNGEPYVERNSKDECEVDFRVSHNVGKGPESGDDVANSNSTTHSGKEDNMLGSNVNTRFSAGAGTNHSPGRGDMGFQNAGSERLEPGGIIDTSSSDDVVADNAPSIPKGVQNETGVLKRKRASINCGSVFTANGANDITVDDIPEVCTAGGSKESISPIVADNVHSSPIGSQNGTGVFKRNRPSNNAGIVRSFDVDDSSSTSVSSSSSSSNSEYSMNFLDEIFSKSHNNTSEKRWIYEADMLDAFQKDDELCMKAVCALYRKQVSAGKSPFSSIFTNNHGFNKSDATRGTNLAEFLIDGDSQGKMKKSIMELNEYDPKGVSDCRRLAIEHSKSLFVIYQNNEDPFFN